LSGDESDELGEGDFREVAFADGSSMKPRATEGMGSRRSGAWRIEEPLRGRWWGSPGPINVEGSEPPSTEKRLSSTEPKRIPLLPRMERLGKFKSYVEFVSGS
jgi:hypothetical protein